MPRRTQKRLVSLVIIPVVLLTACGSDDPVGDRVMVTDEMRSPVLELSDFAIEGDLIVPAGPLVADVQNVAPLEHNVGFEGGPFSELVFGFGSTTFDMGTLEPGEYVLYCDISGHREAGMEAVLTVLPVEDGEMVVPAG